jgi:hypothetical protein
MRRRRGTQGAPQRLIAALHGLFLVKLIVGRLAHEGERNMAPRPKRCIFCDRPEITKEHVFGKWLKPLIPRNMPNYRQLTATQHRIHSDYAHKIRGGDPRSLSVKCVCGKCNNRWMGDLQEETKPILTPLALGHSMVLDRVAQARLSAWISMAVITSEFDNPATVAVPVADRLHLWQTKTAPPDWRIWTGHLPLGQWPALWVHHPLAIAENVPRGTDDGLSRLNTQTTTYVIGQAYIHVLTSTYGDVVSDWRFGSRRASVLTQILPIINDTVSWPPTISMTGDDADFIAGAFFNHCIATERSRTS